MVKRIVEFQSRAECEAVLTLINEIAAAWWQSQDYTVITENGLKQLIGKKNGVDNPDAVRTITWDEVKRSPDNTFYIVSPSTSTNFVDWRDRIPEGVTIPADKDLPTAWEVVEPQ